MVVKVTLISDVLLFFFLLYSDEADEFVEIGALNGIFVLGRSMGFIGVCVCLIYLWRVCYKMMLFKQSYLFLYRSLSGPETVEAGFVSPSLGWYLLRTSRTHDHVMTESRSHWTCALRKQKKFLCMCKCVYALLQMWVCWRVLLFSFSFLPVLVFVRV